MSPASARAELDAIPRTIDGGSLNEPPVLALGLNVVLLAADSSLELVVSQVDQH